MNKFTVELRNLALIMAAATCLGGAGLSAAEAPGPEISWEDVLAAVDHHPLIGVGRGRVAKSDGVLAAAREFPNPEASLAAGQGRPVDGGPSATTYAGELVFPVDWSVVRRPRIAAAKAGTDQARAEADALRQEAVYELRTLFLEIARAQEMLNRLGPFREDYLQLVELVRLRVQSGEARPSDQTRVEAEFQRFSIEMDKIASQGRSNRRALNQWLGGGLPADYRVKFEFAELPDLPPLEEAIARAESANPSLRSARAGIKQADAAVALERAKAVPSLALGGAYAREPDATNAGVVAVVGLPVLNQNRGAVAAARGERQVAGSELDYRVGQVRQEVMAAHGEAGQAREAARTYRDSILPRTEANVRAMEKMYRVGEVSLLEVIDTRRVLLDARLEYVSLLADFHRARARLALLMGEQ